MLDATFQSVLVTTDLSAESDQVVDAAARVARQVGARLHVVHAVNILGRGVSGVPLDLMRLEGLVDQAREALHSQIERVVPPDVAVGSVSIDYKAAAPAILQRAREVAADLIVMGPHSSWVPGSHWVGTTAERVVEKATVPCLVVKEPLRAPPRRVLLPLGEYDIRVGALSSATAWLGGLHRRDRAGGAGAPATELWAFHVIDSPRRWPEISDRFTEEIRGVDAHLPVRPRRRLSWNRDPAAEIVREAEDGEVDLVVLGVRGQGALMRFLAGSVSSAVLRKTRRSVLLIPPRLYERWARRSPAGRGLPAEPIPISRIAGTERRHPLRESGWASGIEERAVEHDDLPEPPEPQPAA